MSYTKFPSINQSLVQNNGEMGEKSCLNWGQREKREPDEAYIRLSSKYHDIGFFPNIGISFQVITPDGYEFTCIREQTNGKAITTVGDKSQLGIYFRNKLGLAHDAFVEARHLENYGRTDVTFYKVTQDESGNNITPYYVLEF